MTTTTIFGFEEDGRLLPKGNDLTNEQLAALDLEQHIVVTAGAGSGKTRTLSRRVLRILGEFAWRAITKPEAPLRGPRNILVSTFTERAAAELQERIRAELLAGIRELEARSAEFSSHPAVTPKLLSALLRRMKTFHTELDQSRIGTFHSFCAAALRECASELELDPGFTILQGPDHAAAIEDVVEQTLSRLERALSNKKAPSSRLHEALRQLLRFFSRRALLQLLTHWLERRGELRTFSQVLEVHSDEELIERWARCYGQADLAELESAVGASSEVAQLLSEIGDLETGYTGPVERKPPIFDVSRHALATTKSQAPSGTAARGQRLRDFLCPFLTGNRKSSQRSLKKAHHTWLGSKKLFTKEEHAQLTSTWNELRAALMDLFGESGAVLKTLPGRADEIGLPVLRSLDTVAQEVLMRFQARKTSESQLDFADLELELLRLLRHHPRGRTRLQQRYEHLLIDEFQDTNAIQWNIVKLLAGDPLPKRGLFLVGDPKQAIYRFRGGDVTLFDRAIAEICSEKNPALNFSFNFRSRREFIPFFNHLFGWLLHDLGPDRPEWEAPFASLEPGRESKPGEAPGQIEMLWLHDDANPSANEEEDANGSPPTAQNPLLATSMPLGREASLVAQTLRDQALPGASAHKGIKAAILLRRRANLAAYAFALRQAGVPHVVARGRGFFARQEVLDVANLLLALSCPDDGIALIGSLRGPFLGLEDAWLLWLSAVGAGAGHRALTKGWEACLNNQVHLEQPELWGELPETGKSEIHVAANRFRRWQALCRHLPLSAFLRELFHESRAFHMFHLADTSGQALANIEKLQSLAAGYDHRGAEGIADFALFLRDQEEAQTNEGDASIDATAPVVLMTIHQSKGLEFPIVVLPDLQQKISISDPKPLSCARLGEQVDGEDLWELGLRIPVEQGERSHEAMVLRTLINERNRNEELAESRRLLYVAMTRARDRLICVSRPPSKTARTPRGREDSTSWEEWLRSWLAAGGSEFAAVTTELQPTDLTMVDAPLPKSKRPPKAAQRDIAPLPMQEKGVITPHALGPKAQLSTHTATPLQPSEPRFGKLRGLLIHACLEDGLYEMSAEVHRRLAQALAREGLLAEHHLSSLTLELQTHLEGFRAAAPRQLLEEKQHTVFRELAFQLALPGNKSWLKGVIDLVYRDEERRCWVVVDYKSDSSDIPSLTERYRGQLTAYAWAVAQILPDLVENEWHVETQLLCTAHGARVVVTPAMTAGQVTKQFFTALKSSDRVGR